MRSSWSVLYTEVQVEPVGQLDLEAHSDSIVSLLTGDVQDEAAEKRKERHFFYCTLFLQCCAVETVSYIIQVKLHAIPLWTGKLVVVQKFAY